MNSTTLKFNTSAFARAMGGRQDFNKLRDMLTESNYTVNGERLPNGDVCMVVSDINESAFINMADRCQLYEAEDYLLDDIYNDQPDDDLETLMNDCDDCDDCADGNNCSELEDTDSDFAEEDTMTEEYFDPEFEDDVVDDSFLDDTDDFDTVDFDEDFDSRDIDEYDDTLDADYYAAYDIDECIHEALGTKKSRNSRRLNEGLDGYAEMALQDVDPSFVDAGELTDDAIDFFENAKKELEERIGEIEIGDYYISARDNDVRLNQYTRQILADLFGEPEAIAINIIAELTDDMYFENFIADYFGDDLFVFESRRSRNSRRLNESLSASDVNHVVNNITEQLYDSFAVKPVIMTSDQYDSGLCEYYKKFIRTCYVQNYELTSKPGYCINSVDKLIDQLSHGKAMADKQHKPFIAELYLSNIMHGNLSNAIMSLVDMHQIENIAFDNTAFVIVLDNDCDESFVDELTARTKSIKLNEKKKGCCPPKRRSNILRPISEAFTAYKEEDQKKLDKAITSIQDVVKAVKNTTIGAVEVADAFKKLKAQQNAIKKIPRTKDTMFKITDVPGVAGVIKKMIAADPDKAKEIKKFRDSLTESVVTSLANKKKSLHESVKIDGVAVPNLKNKQLANMLKEAVETKKKYTKMLSEACGDAEKTNRCKKVINNKNMLITVLAEELSYRKLAAEFKHTIFEADEKEHKEKTTDATELSDEDLATMMGGVDNNPETDKDKADDQEEFDIARIKIRLASKEAAEELKDLCTEAGIPEDAMEIEEDEEEDGADTDKAAEDEDGETEDKDGDTNESIRYSNIRKLFEADEEEADDNTETEGDAKDNAEGAEETDGDEKSEEGEVMFVLTDTDYLEELITVLDDNYGISKEDFQEMTGVDLVEEDSDDSDDDAFDDTEDKDDKKDEAEEISAEDVFAGM